MRGSPARKLLTRRLAVRLSSASSWLWLLRTHSSLKPEGGPLFQGRVSPARFAARPVGGRLTGLPPPTPQPQPGHAGAFRRGERGGPLLRGQLPVLSKLLVKKGTRPQEPGNTHGARLKAHTSRSKSLRLPRRSVASAGSKIPPTSKMCWPPNRSILLLRIASHASAPGESCGPDTSGKSWIRPTTNGRDVLCCTA